MDNDKELRQIFNLPSMPKDIADSMGLDIEEYLDVELPSKKKYKPRGIAFSREADNPQKARWTCLECGMVSSISGIVKHQKNRPDHKGKQQVFATLESLGII